MKGLYKCDEEYLLVEDRLTPETLNNLNLQARRIAVTQILSRLDKEEWFICKAYIPERHIGKSVMLNKDTLLSEFTLIEETDERHDKMCDKIKEYDCGSVVSIYI